MDAEGSFIISIYKRANNNKWQVKASFELGLHSKDKSTLEDIKEFFGVGIVNIRKYKNLISFSVNKNRDINVIIPHFSKFPLQ